jgi:hypothetical protein
MALAAMEHYRNPDFEFGSFTTAAPPIRASLEKPRELDPVRTR